MSFCLHAAGALNDIQRIWAEQVEMSVFTVILIEPHQAHAASVPVVHADILDGEEGTNVHGSGLRSHEHSDVIECSTEPLWNYFKAIVIDDKIVFIIINVINNNKTNQSIIK